VRPSSPDCSQPEASSCHAHLVLDERGAQKLVQDVRVQGRVRLDRALSKLGIASRTDARKQIEEGAVEVDGRVQTNPAMLVVPERIRITLRGSRTQPAQWRSIALYKPRGYVTTRRDPEGRPTVFELLGAEAAGLVAAGRLDLASAGLLLLTTDTRLSGWLTDPTSRVTRRYAVVVRGVFSDESAQRLRQGFDNMRADAVIIRKRSKRETHLIVELTEGRNREIRRMMSAASHEVTRLLRVAYGGIELGKLQPGEWRHLAREELRAAFPGAPIRKS
jgi:23S rRNA pseudouridine2605 synthase